MITTTSASLSVRACLAVWGWLAGLMLLGVFVSELPISKLAIVQAVLALSTVKAVLVARYYMHLKFDRRVVTIVAVSPLVVIGLATLLLYSSRLVKL